MIEEAVGEHGHGAREHHREHDQPELSAGGEGRVFTAPEWSV